MLECGRLSPRDACYCEGGHIVLAGCPQCGGVFVDRKAFTSLVTAVERAVQHLRSHRCRLGGWVKEAG